MAKPRIRRKNKYQESTLARLRGYFRTIRCFLIVFAWFCLAAVLGAGLTRLYHKVVNASWLRLEKIEITGIGKLPRAEVLNVMGLDRGQCTLNINTKQVAERLEKLPEVRKASVRLESFRRIMVTIVERRPAAIVRCGAKNMLMGFDGVLFSRADPGEKRPLLLVSGLCNPNLKKGDSVSPQNLQLIRNLRSAVTGSKSWLSETAIEECRWGKNGFTLVLGERGVPVSIGKDDFKEKFAKLRKVIDTLNKRGWTDSVTGIDLDYAGKAYVEGQFTFPQPVQGPAKRRS